MIGLFVLNDDHDQDFLQIGSESINVYYTSAVGTLDYDSATATFVAGTDYAQATKTAYYNESDGSNNEVEAILKTAEMLDGRNIDVEFTALTLAIKTNVVNNSFNVRQFSDMFSVERSDVDQINFYNDNYEINSGVTTTRVGGTRNAIIHKDIPIRAGQGNAIAIQLEASNEGEFHELKMKFVDPAEGGNL